MVSLVRCQSMGKWCCKWLFNIFSVFKACIQEACQSQSNSATISRQHDCVGVHQEEGRNSFVLPLYQESHNLVQNLSKKGNGKDTIWVSFRRKSGSRHMLAKWDFQLFHFVVLRIGWKLSVYTTLDAFHLRDATFFYIFPCGIRNLTRTAENRAGILCFPSRESLLPVRGWTGFCSSIVALKHFLFPSHTGDSVPVMFVMFQHPCRESWLMYQASEGA